MSDRIETVVVVTDKGSQTFDKVGTSATKMGASIDKASTQSSTSLTKLSKAGAVAGAAFTSMAGVLGVASRANADAEAAQARYQAAVEATGHTMDEYSAQLAEASKRGLQLGFDDEDLSDAVAQLTVSTHDTTKAINDMSLAEDIARARKISLADAARIVGLAEQGRTGSLIRLGVVIDRNASKEQAVAALQKTYAGQAEAYSKTTAAGYDRLRNSAENALEAIGAHLGPMNELLMIAPGVSAGFTLMGAAIGALAPEFTAAAAGAAVLDIALGPIGLAALAIGAGIAIYELSQHLGGDLPAGAEAANTALEATNEILRQQIELGSVVVPLVKETADVFGYISGSAKDYDSTLAKLTDTQQKQAGYVKAAREDYGAQSTQFAFATAQVYLADQALTDYIVTQGKGQITAAKAAEANNAANDILTSTQPAAATARQELEKLEGAVQSGAITWPKFADAVIATAAGMPALSETMIKSGETTRGVTEKAKDFINTATGWRMSIAVLGDEYTNLDGAIGDTSKTITAAASDHEKVMAAIEATTAKTKQQTDTTIQYTHSIGQLDTFLKKLATTHQATVAIIGANKLVNATQALGSAINVVIDNTNSLASQSSGLNDWALKLINVKGVVGEIDTLYANHQITLTTYNKAQQAQIDISAANASIQEDVLRIQTKQAPLLADAIQQEAKYIDTLADLPPTQQLVQLGWMDQAESLKAQNALQLAAAASAGDLGEAGTKAAQSAITAAAEADPVLKAMLVDMGLISVGADGTITLNFPDSETVQSAVDNLTLSIDALTVAVGGVPPMHTTEFIVHTADATGKVNSYNALLDSINGKEVITRVYVGLYGPGIGYQNLGQLGGVVPHAQTGSLTQHATPVIVNEAGPEMVRLPGGSLIYPAGASKEMANRMGGRGDIHLHSSTINLYPADTNVYDALRSHLYAGTRN